MTGDALATKVLGSSFVRPSQRHMLRRCPSSQAGDYTLTAESDAIDLGTETDRAMGHVYRGESTGPLSPEVAERVERGRIVIAALGDKLAGCIVQGYLNGPMGGGTADLVNLLLVLDWKSREGEHKDQLMHYGHSLRASGHDGHLGDKRITLIAAWLAEGGGKYEVWDVGDDDLDAWEADQHEMERKIGHEYNPGEHCAKCHRRLDCHVRQSWATSALMVLGAGPVPAERAAAHYAQVQQLEKFIEQYRAVMRETVAATGPLPAGDGMELALTETTRSEVDTAQAMNLLMSIGWTSEDIAAACRLSLTEVKRQARAAAPRGAKDDAEKEIVELLSPATTTKTIVELRLRKARET
jgi:hypothetical protein